MAIAPQTAMPQYVPTARPALVPVRTSRHSVLSPVPEPRVAGVVVRIIALATACAFGVGVLGGLAVALATGAISQIAR
jgi:hypothetical protein